MASTNNNVSNNENNQTSGEEERVDVGTLVFNVSNDDLDKIKEKIGDILQAQLILRGDNSLGYGKVIFSGPGASNAEGGDISGDARLTRGSRRGRGAARGGRGARRNAARARRSADEQEGEESTVTAAANGVTSVVSGLVDGVKNLVVGGTEAAATGAEEGAAEKGTGNAAGRGGKGKRGRGAARAARPRKERGEPSKTLVFIRNIPFSYAEEQVRSLFAEHNLSFSSLSMPVWKFGPHKGKGRGFAFATVSNEEEQKKTIETLNGKEIHTGEMYTPRAHKAPATALAEGSGAITAQGETQPTAAGEVAQPEPTERVLKLVARQGFENEEKNTEEQHEQEGAAADAADAAAAAAANGTGPADSGTA